MKRQRRISEKYLEGGDNERPTRSTGTSLLVGVSGEVSKFKASSVKNSVKQKKKTISKIVLVGNVETRKRKRLRYSNEDNRAVLAARRADEP